MQVNGIIAEYNPFHNGHKYHLEESLRRTGADYTVIVMSGNFVQRGEPALLDKRIRTQMALCCGADLVLELPVLYATSSSEFFADGAAALLDKLGVVTHLCFGSECGDAALLKDAADLLAEEPAPYRLALKQGLKQGLTYPQARIHGLTQLPAEHSKDLKALLHRPNNILGIDYIRALSKRHSSMQPATIARQGAGYNDKKLHGAPSQTDPAAGSDTVPFCCSALSIRQALLQELPIDQLAGCMPPEAFRLLQNYLENHKPVYGDLFSSLLHYKLLLGKNDGYERYLDMSHDLSNRILKHLGEFGGFTAFCELLKTKNTTYARISRCLLHILLNLGKKDLELAREMDLIPYARVLGFRKTAHPLLHAIRCNCAIPLVTKLADAGRLLPPKALQLLELDLMAAQIYHTAIQGNGSPIPNEAATPLVII